MIQETTVSLIVTDPYKTRYIEIVESLVTQVHIKMNTIYSDLSNTAEIQNLNTIRDVEMHNDQFVLMLRTYIEFFNTLVLQSKQKHHLWLKDFLKSYHRNIQESQIISDNTDLKQETKKGHVILIDDSDSDVEIVNEACYLIPQQIISDNDDGNSNDYSPNKYKNQDQNKNEISAKDYNLDKTKADQTKPEGTFEKNSNQFENSKVDNNFTKNEFKTDNNIAVDLNDSFGKSSNNSDLDYNYYNLNYNYSGLNDCERQKALDNNTSLNDNICDLNTSQKIINLNNINSMENTNLKLIKNCSVLLEPLTQEYHREDYSKLKDSSDDDSFERLIDLSGLEKSRNKRQYSSSNSSDGSCSNSCSDNSKQNSDEVKKNRYKKIRKCSESSESEINSISNTSDSDKDSDNHSVFDNPIISRFSTDDDDGEKREKQKLLEKSDDSDDYGYNESEEEDLSKDLSDNSNTNSDKRIYKKQKPKEMVNYSDSSNEETTEKDKSHWLDDEVLRYKITIENSKKKRKHRRNSTENSGDSLGKSKSIRKKKKKKPLRLTSDSCGSSTADDPIDDELADKNADEEENHGAENGEIENLNVSLELQTSIGSGQKKSGRRNIRKLLDDQNIGEGTKQAAKEEDHRVQRLTKRQEQISTLFPDELRGDCASLVLDIDLISKEELVTVDEGLVKHLKPHQIKGVKFMWDACFESLDMAQRDSGSGCILAHCMGLGKTFQIVTLAHTVLTNAKVGVFTIMVICPTNTVFNWVDEFNIWLKHARNKEEIKIYQLSQTAKYSSRLSNLEAWQTNGGVLIISYDMFRILTAHGQKCTSEQEFRMKRYLLDPGADLVVCDEGHKMKNENTQMAQRMYYVRTKRRIILTGTPLQNNLKEYHCMVQIVKPKLLGTKIEFLNRFVNPITNGQFEDSTAYDVKLMKQRAHVLHKMLESCVQRCDYTVLTPFLPQKQEYAVFIRLSEEQEHLYKSFVNNIDSYSTSKGFLKNYQEIERICAHPWTLVRKEQTAKRPITQVHCETNVVPWWSSFIKIDQLENLHLSNKLVFLFGILERSQKDGDKILVFSQSLQTLDIIEIFLKKVDAETKMPTEDGRVSNFKGEWKNGLDYFRLDGTVRPEKRNALCKKFNNPDNKRARLFLISTKAGGLGINLVGANRVIVFDPSWNPSLDLQGIFRVYRFGQRKPCFIYRFLSAGTMEEKIYNRQVTKLSLSLRVIDEQQIERHYRDSDLAELYKYESYVDNVPTVNVPKDHLLADVFLNFKSSVYNIVEHDSLLQNMEEEELNEDERKQAWVDYEQEKLVKQYSDNVKANQKKRPVPVKSESTGAAETSPLVASDDSKPAEETVQISETTS